VYTECRALLLYNMSVIQNGVHWVPCNMSMRWEMFKSTNPASWLAEQKPGEIPHWRSRLWSTNDTGHLCWYFRRFCDLLFVYPTHL